jgi:flagellar basal-body rod protein FlgF
MLRGLYTAASGLIAQQNRHNTITNDLANMNTPGYKQSVAALHSFPEKLMYLIDVKNEKKKSIGSMYTGVLSEENVAYMRQGDLIQTNRPADFAIISNIAVPGVTFDSSGKAVSADGTLIYQPQAYFTVRDITTGDNYYTRAGHFVIDTQGFLTTGDGSSVLNSNGEPIVIPNGTTMEQLSVTPDFQLYNSTTNENLGQFLISRIDNPNELISKGNTKFMLADGATATTAQVGDGVEVRQNYLEGSNVDPAQSAVNLMSALRAYEANQKVVQFFDRSLDKAVNEIGKV